MIIGNRKLEKFVKEMCDDAYTETGKDIIIQIGEEVFTYDGFTFGMDSSGDEEVAENPPETDFQEIYEKIRNLLEGYETLLKIHNSVSKPFEYPSVMWYSSPEGYAYNNNKHPYDTDSLSRIKKFMTDEVEKQKLHFSNKLDKDFPKVKVWKDKE